MKNFRFLEWKVYQDAKYLFSLILELVKKLPKEYRFELVLNWEVKLSGQVFQ